MSAAENGLGSGSLSMHDFSERLAGQSVYFHVLRMSGSFFLWVGTAPTLSNLAVAMSTRLDPTPVSSLILGDTSDTTPNSLAQRLENPASQRYVGNGSNVFSAFVAISGYLAVTLIWNAAEMLCQTYFSAHRHLQA
ncbi:proteasome assembly chaperone 4 isoform X1 [Mobula hypostoma]|uniref:proteasome assembly chaperone 4 isoform X1 n=1 Tax=Mobula hypostoma TaxID=723540 RepID=UPI002FC327BE